jgi:hypothetical protein
MDGVMKTPTLTLTAAIFVSFALACVTLSPQALAVCQEGCDLGKNNTFLGNDALINNTTGDANVAIGTSALFTNTAGYLNTATGAGALNLNTTGSLNTATGSGALYNNTTGNFNTAIGEAALAFNTTGNSNTATGAFTLDQNTTGFQNTATGRAALANNTDGSENTATGFHALLNNTTGNKNIALGFRAGSNLTTGDKNIDIGNAGLADESRTIRIGRVQDQTATFIAGIAGATVPTGVAVVVDSTGHLGTVTSSARSKEAINPMDKASEAILALQPVTFRYKKELDPDAIPQFGLVAEDVAKVDPDLVAKDDQGKPYTVRYEAVNAMLLNEFLKEHKKVEEQAKKAEAQARKVDAQASKIEQLEAQLQQMAARLDAKGL